MDWLALLKDWTPTAAMLGALTLVARWFRDQRRDRMTERKDDRSGWGELISTLQADVKAIREERHDCEERCTALERELHHVHRQVIALALRYSIPLDDLSPAMQHAVATVAKVMTKDE